MLLNGFGGLVLTAKPDDLHTWAKRYFRKTNRPPQEDLVVIGPESAHPEAIWPEDVLGEHQCSVQRTGGELSTAVA